VILSVVLPDLAHRGLAEALERLPAGGAVQSAVEEPYAALSRNLVDIATMAARVDHSAAPGFTRARLGQPLRSLIAFTVLSPMPSSAAILRSETSRL